MARYHLTAKGEPALCRAQVGNCPLGEEHFARADDARAAYENLQVLATPEPLRKLKPQTLEDLRYATDDDFEDAKRMEGPEPKAYESEEHHAERVRERARELARVRAYGRAYQAGVQLDRDAEELFEKRWADDFHGEKGLRELADNSRERLDRWRRKSPGPGYVEHEEAELERLEEALATRGRSERKSVEHVEARLEAINGPDTSYRMTHQPRDTGAPGYDLSEVLPDVYEHPEYYGNPRDLADAESIRAIRAMRGKPDAMVTVYRATPKAEYGIQPGNWVTLSRRYAVMHGQQETQDMDWPVVEMQVRARELRCDGDSMSEFGYFPSA